MDGSTYLIFFPVLLLVGLCLGSFATALIHRIPRNIPWIVNTSSSNKACRSQCTHCGHILGIADLVPFFSWLCSKGKCRHCGHTISAQYPLTEIITAILVLALYAAYGTRDSVIPLMFAVPFMVAATKIDWDHMILPDSLNLALAILAFVHVVVISMGELSVLMVHILAALILPAFFWMAAFLVGRLKNKQALGRGDLKFLPVAGLFLGVQALPSYMVLGGVVGIGTALIRAKQGKKGAFPFGPALIISLYIHLILTGLGFDYKW